MIGYDGPLCTACGGYAHPGMRFERVCAALFNGTFAALEWITRVPKK